jgi:hypothetical protein
VTIQRNQLSITHILIVIAIVAITLCTAGSFAQPAIGIVGFAKSMLYMFAGALTVQLLTHMARLNQLYRLVIGPLACTVCYTLGWVVVQRMHADDVFWRPDEIPVWQTSLVLLVTFAFLGVIGEAVLHAIDSVLQSARTNQRDHDS